MNDRKRSASTSDADGSSTSPTLTRRKLLAALGAGGVVTSQTSLPQAWTRPVVETLMLPAHAQTTAPATGGESRLGADDTGPCTPDCGDGRCGPDGCGGDCGGCGLNEICVDGDCVQLQG